MKKGISMILTLLLLVSVMLSGCGGSSEKTEAAPAEDSVQGEQTDQAKDDVATDGMGELLSAAYVDIMKGEEYLMKYKVSMEVNGQTVNMEATMAVSGDKTALISSTNGMESDMIEKDGKVYMIDHASKTVTEWEQTAEMKAQAEAEKVDMNGLSYVGTGKEDGLIYEEYTTELGTLKYYFDGEKLVKIKMSGDEAETVMEIEELTKDVPPDMFELPAGYQTIGM